MPLFIDLHVDPNLTPEEVKQCHVADKAIQQKYGVRYLQILLNQPQGHLFCLVEGPDKETCARVHREAHGNVACNILEITESDFSTLLLGKQKDQTDFTLNDDNSVDTGVRALLSFSLLGNFKKQEAAKHILLSTLQKFGGKNTEGLLHDSFVIFQSCTSAVDAAHEARTTLLNSDLNIEVRFGISLGMPLDKEGNFFESTRKAAGQLAFIADPDMILLSVNSAGVYNGKHELSKAPFKRVTAQEEKFVSQIAACLEREGTSPDLNIVELAEKMNMSKSQFTRKLKAVSELSPNDLVKEFRLRKSIQLMQERGMNIAEVTMAVGFSNPSYFTKCFRARFGQSPSEYLS